MRKNTDFLSVAYFVFFALIMLSGTLRGVLSEAVYYLAYVIPFLLAVTLLKNDAVKKDLFSLDKSRVKLFVPVVFPTIFFIVLLSFLSSIFIFYTFGKASAVDLGENAALAILYHAALPAILEELLFRYLPLRFIAPHSKRYAVIFSSLAFALVHHSFFSIPYALFAGAAFITVDIMFDSLLPSLILHFLNNALSVIWTMWFSSGVGNVIFASAVAALALASLVPLILKRKAYLSRLSEIFSGKCDRYVSLGMILLVFATLFVAVYELCA